MLPHRELHANALPSAEDGDEDLLPRLRRSARGVERERLPASRASWSRLLRMVIEVDPLDCSRCSEKGRWGEEGRGIGTIEGKTGKAGGSGEAGPVGIHYP